MSAWLDLIGSLVVGGLLALTAMSMNQSITEHSYQSSMTYMAQSKSGTVSDILEDDFWKMGYGVTGTAITAADTNQIQFWPIWAITARWIP